jgi:hypothetical protein
MMSRDRIKERCRVPTRELLGLVAGTWLAFLFPAYLGGDDGSAGGPRAGEIRESVSGLCLCGDLGAAAQSGRGSPPQPFPACEAGNFCLVRGTWNAECIEGLCLLPMGTYADQVDLGRTGHSADTRWRDIDDVEVDNIADNRLVFDDRAGSQRMGCGERAKAARLRPVCVLFTSSVRPICVLFESLLRPKRRPALRVAHLRPVCVLFGATLAPLEGTIRQFQKRIVGWALFKDPFRPSHD